MKITIHDLKKQFNQQTAVDVNALAINHGDIVGLVGNNGAGKTTLFRLLLDLIKADGGEVLFTSCATSQVVNPALSDQWKQIVGAYIDASFLIDYLTPEEYLDFVARVNSLPLINWENLEGSVLAPYLRFANDELFGKNKYIRNFSAGNKQKIGIISTLLSRPELVILDEPFNFLDPSGQLVLKQLITDYHQATGATILVSSHNLQHTIDVCNRIILLEHGKIVADLNNSNGDAASALASYFAADI